MSHAVQLSVVIWSKTDKRIEKFSVSKESTFGEVIDTVDTAEICVERALVGHKSRPFQLMPCDFTGNQRCRGVEFGTKVFDTVFWMNYDDEVEYAATQLELCRKVLPLSLLEGCSIHLFTYNHQAEDCCEGDNGPWTERDPEYTDERSTLWLRLEKEFIENGRVCDDDWTLATLKSATPVAVPVAAPVAAPDGVHAMLYRLYKYTLPEPN
jgi:hypothetical protein